TENQIDDLEMKLCELIASAQFFNQQAKRVSKIVKKFKNKDREKVKALTLHSFLYFKYVLSVLKTLFESSDKPQEQSFALWRREKGVSFGEMQEGKDFQKILNDYKKSNLKTFRDRITDHRDRRNPADVVSVFLNLVKEEHLQKA